MEGVTDYPIIPVSVETLTLHWAQLGAQYALPFAVLNNAKFDVHQTIAEHLVVSVRTFVLEERLADEEYTATLEVPANAWQMFKRDHLPWLAKRRPVRFTTHTAVTRVERTRIFPEAQVPRTFGHSLRIDRVSSGTFTH